MAGENKVELIKVLEYYKNQNNKEKLKAAKFLISNLPNNYSYDTINLYKSVIKDIKVIKSDFLINNINLAYNSWKTNPYARDSVSFNHFCEYILPYRHIQGKAIENWRDFFIKKNQNHFKDSYPMSFTKACDSLFIQYKEYKFDYWIIYKRPILKFKDFMKIKRGNCAIKSWFNAYLVNAEGIPMVIDFVPAWGTREGDHQWNALLYGGKTLYFESFWESGNNWFYNPKINNNRFEDDWSGKIRLPKIYRHTFSTHIEGPISDNRLKIEDIPPLFRDIKKIDVSDSYFKAINVEIKFTKAPPKNTYYLYLSVLGVNKKWVPVQWGKITGNKVIFNKMGTDIVYQPGYYKSGTIIPFGNPFHLDHNGNQREFMAEGKRHEVIIKRKYPEKKGLLKEAKLLKGTLIQASNRKDFKNFTILRKINFEPELRPYDIKINPKNKYRYYRLYSKNKITVKKIELFYENLEGKEVSLKGDFISNSSNETDSITWKGIDLGSPQYISKFRFTSPNNLNHVFVGGNYELFYADEGSFISLGKKKADSSCELKFDNVPKRALLYLKCLDGGRQERIFEYRNGKQIWY
ncbi:hypothetical protein [Polaribacter cellanae]|uniref:Transglutaminase domain-containing protein n=1 Tax=Polaribacter cellanae TaxID=2818493 RepID=A0A975H9Y5_9FLAO|nr:hypothetical protein [Polaribacter cellanae]QTE23535.1 hypothetical protein J3359_04430 [Polaribacter cellanae]